MNFYTIYCGFFGGVTNIKKTFLKLEYIGQLAIILIVQNTKEECI